MNIFRIANKGKVVTYKITRKVKVLQSIAPLSGQMKVEGGTKIDVSAIAYTGSVVTAKLNGKTITLTETDGQWDGSDPNSSYAKFTGSFNTPAGIISKEQNLGNVVVSGSYQKSNYENLTGASVIVNALPEPPPPPPVDSNPDEPTPDEPTQGTPQKLIKITTNSSFIYDETSTYAYPIPKTRLPIGTYDYWKSTVTYNLTKYYITQSGRRIKASDATLIDGTTIVNNNLSVLESSVQNYDTVIKFNMKSKIPFDISYSPCSYYNGGAGNYDLKSFSPAKITISFDYVSGVGAAPTFGAGALFTSGSWSTSTYNGLIRHNLTLNLAKAGGYSGVTPSYSDDGVLTLRFNGHPSTLAGAVIVIDPGHGIGSKTSGVFDPGAVGEVKEQTVNLAVAKLVEQKLVAAGATVHRLKTESQEIYYAQRPYEAAKFNPDIFVSIHCNSWINSSAHGTESIYFQSFSQPFAKYLTDNVYNYWVSKDISTAYNRGYKYNEYAVTLDQGFPSSLVELAFVSNSIEGPKLGLSDYQNGLADAIVKSMSQYFANN